MIRVPIKRLTASFLGVPRVGFGGFIRTSGLVSFVDATELGEWIGVQHAGGSPRRCLVPLLPRCVFLLWVWAWWSLGMGSKLSLSESVAAMGSLRGRLSSTQA